MLRITVANLETDSLLCNVEAETVALITASDEGLEYQGFKGYWGSTDAKLLEAMTIALEEELERHGLPKRAERDE